jgi:hypothetical protein
VLMLGDVARLDAREWTDGADGELSDCFGKSRQPEPGTRGHKPFFLLEMVGFAISFSFVVTVYLLRSLFAHKRSPRGRIGTFCSVI